MQTNQIRLHHIDLLRGLIIVFMIIDHGMYYSGSYNVSDPMNVAETEPHIFFTRFLAHFCAPLFVFLAGLSAAMTENRFETSKAFAKSLIVRGAVLILFEFTIISWSWSFNPLFPMLYAQVIWAIGWGFIFLGLMRLIDVKAVLAMGVIIVLGHNSLAGINFEPGTFLHYVWSVLYQKNVLALPFDFKIRTTYPILSIVGLMAVGYMAGRYYVKNKFSSHVEKQALIAGFVCIGAYCILRGFNIYGDSGQFVVYDSTLQTLMSFLNPTKYPLSLQFMLITVGTGLIMLFVFKRTQPNFSQGVLQALGKTSMFSYIAHLYLLHLIAWLLIPVLGFSFSDMTYGETLVGLPAGYGMSYLSTLLFIGVTTVITLLLARLYLPWKKANKHTFIAKYI